jgi:hypothetical protein
MLMTGGDPSSGRVLVIVKSFLAGVGRLTTSFEERLTLINGDHNPLSDLREKHRRGIGCGVSRRSSPAAKGGWTEGHGGRTLAGGYARPRRKEID